MSSFVKGVKLLVVNALWVICSLPIFTIGASSCAACYVCLKLLNEEDGNVVSWFFKSFKENFKKSTIIWLIILITSIVLGVNLVFWLKCGLSLSYFALPFIFFSLLIFLLVTPYIFPILTKTKCSILNTFKYCFVISLKNLPYSLLITLFGASILFATFYFPIVFLFMLLLGVSLHSYMVSRIFLIVFNKDINLFNKIIS